MTADVSSRTARRAAPGGPRRASVPAGRIRLRRIETLSLAVPILVAAVLTGLHVSAYTTVSLFDEHAHFGYVYDIRQGQLPHKGSTLPAGAIDEVACRRWDSGFALPCAGLAKPQPGTVHASDLPAEGWIYTVNHPPLYYAVAAVVGRAIGAIPGVHSYFVAVRLAGILWTAASLLFLWLILRRMRVPALGRFGALMLVASTPAVVYAGSIVNPDVTALPCMLAMIWALVRWEQGRRQPWLLLLIGALAVACKITNVIIPLGALVFLLVRSLQTGDWRGPDRRLRTPSRLLAALSLGAGSLVVYAGWTAYLRFTDASMGRNPLVNRDVSAFPWSRVIRFDSVFLLQPPLGKLPLPIIPEIWLPVFPTIVSALAVLPILGCVAVLARQSSDRLARSLAITGLVMSIVGPSAFVLFNYLSAGDLIPSPSPRYFYATLGFQFAALGLAVAYRRLGQLALGVGVASSLLYGGLLLAAI